MISSISGEIIAVTEDTLTIEVNGLGFDVAVPRSLAIEHHAGQKISLFTHLIVRQDLLALYGFTSLEERAYFLLLLGVEGIGPRSAMATISTLSPEAIRRAVLSEQPEIFNRVPGIGKKTAQKIIIHLQGRVKGTGEMEPASRFDNVDSQVFEALVELGYSVVEAQTAIQSLPADAPEEVGERLRIALQFFS
jgi:Holliday junction DNA helicase RuvA